MLLVQVIDEAHYATKRHQCPGESIMSWTAKDENNTSIFFLNSYCYPGWHPYGQAGWLPSTQVLKGSLLLESGKKREGEKEKVHCSYELGDELTTCPLSVQCA